MSGHGRGALARTAFMRYTLRAYLEAGLEPRVALQVAGRVIDENLGGDFATVLLAVHDPDTGSLTYATAGHPAPIVVGPQVHEPVTAGSSPPIGVGLRTGVRQTTVPLAPGSVASLFTDGLMEARVDGGMLGRDSLQQLLADLGPEATAAALIDSVRSEARVLSDDIAAVVIQPTGETTAGLFRTEQLELTSRELDSQLATRFLAACGVASGEIETALNDARSLADRFGGVILHVVFGNRLRVEVLPRNVESIEAASRRASTAAQRLSRRARSPRQDRPPGRSARRRGPDHLGARVDLEPLLEEYGMKDPVAHGPDQSDWHGQGVEALVDRAHQPRAPVVLGQRDLALEREGADS